MKKEIQSAEAMKEWGNLFASFLEGGEFVELIGDIGAGKTTFTKGLADGLGVSETVQSPTFTISRVYDGRDNLRLAHYDFYRLSDAGIMADELAETVADQRVITVVEWGDVISEVRPADRLSLEIASISDDARLITVTATGDKSVRLMEKLQ